MSTRGKLLRTPADGAIKVRADMGFVHCLSAMKMVEDGKIVALLGECNVPRPYARMLERVAMGLGNAPAPFIGCWPQRLEEGVVLLVGDRPSFGKSSSLPNWPFISGIATGCSVWLAEHLEAAGIPEHRLCWVNSYDREGKPVDLSIVRWAPFRKIIALGKYAHQALGHIHHEQVYHPQYWKRAHPTHAYHLLEMLK